MNILGMSIVVAMLLMIALICLLCYSIRKERMDIIEKAKAMKYGDLYKREYAKVKNPFLNPIFIYVKIVDVKFDTSGEPWVCYNKIRELPYSYYDKVSDFLSKYQPVNQGGEK